MSSTPKHVPFEIFDETRRDRDLWRLKARQFQTAAQTLERELFNLRRQARDKAKFDAFFGGTNG